MGLWEMTAGGDYEAAQAERTKWFAKIEPAGNWKRPIDCWIDADDFDDCSAAAVWFTGAPLTVIGTSFTKLHVVGPGYYAAVGA